ncbi:MAG: glutathione peroxidase [Planctomycetota bacterium]
MRYRRTTPGNLLLFIAAVSVCLGTGHRLSEQANASDNKEKDVQTDVPAVLDFKMESIEGDEVELARYHGDVVLIVNVASKCGLTPQYKQLQQLHEDYADEGLSILGFPANNFGRQEPGSNDEIATFCEKNYGVEFDMFAKVSVAGDDQAPLYTFLTGEETNPEFAGKIGWNFEKFLVGRDGRVIARFSPRTRPNAKEVLQALKEALAQPVPEGVKAKEQGGASAE